MYKTFGGLKRALERENIKTTSPDLSLRGGGLSLSDGKNFCNLQLVQFPGNCGILVAHSFGGFLNTKMAYRTIEYAKFLARAQKYGFLLYSCTKDQESIIKLLTDLGFKKGKWHRNPRHNSEICIFSYDVNDLVVDADED